jgi:hypothetical protein
MNSNAKKPYKEYGSVILADLFDNIHMWQAAEAATGDLGCL